MEWTTSQWQPFKENVRLATIKERCFCHSCSNKQPQTKKEHPVFMASKTISHLHQLTASQCLSTCGKEVGRETWLLQISKESAVDVTTGKERFFNYEDQQ